MRPGRSVRKTRPSEAKSMAQGVCNLLAKTSTLGVAFGWDGVVGMALSVPEVAFPGGIAVGEAACTDAGVAVGAAVGEAPFTVSIAEDLAADWQAMSNPMVAGSNKARMPVLVFTGFLEAPPCPLEGYVK